MLGHVGAELTAGIVSGVVAVFLFRACWCFFSMSDLIRDYCRSCGQFHVRANDIGSFKCTLFPGRERPK